MSMSGWAYKCAYFTYDEEEEENEKICGHVNMLIIVYREFLIKDAVKSQSSDYSYSFTDWLSF